MSSFSDILAGIRKAILIGYRVTELAERLKELDRREMDTRERVTRMEGLIAGAQMRASARRVGSKKRD